MGDVSLRRLSQSDLRSVMDLFCNAFGKDHYFAKMYPCAETRLDDMRLYVSPIMDVILEHGMSEGIYKDGTLAAFAICFDYKKMRAEHEGVLRNIFDHMDDADQAFILRNADAEENVIYLLFLAASEKEYGSGLESLLLSRAVDENKGRTLISDVSDMESLSLYRQRGFSTERISDEYYLVTLRN